MLLAGELLTLSGASKWHGLIRVAAGRRTTKEAAERTHHRVHSSRLLVDNRQIALWAGCLLLRHVAGEPALQVGRFAEVLQVVGQPVEHSDGERPHALLVLFRQTGNWTKILRRESVPRSFVEQIDILHRQRVVDWLDVRDYGAVGNGFAHLCFDLLSDLVSLFYGPTARHE